METHPGNIHYHQLISEYYKSYHENNDNKKKNSIIQTIIETFASLNPPGKFYQPIKGNKYEQLTPIISHQKIQESFRNRKIQFIVHTHDNHVLFEDKTCTYQYGRDLPGNTWLRNKLEEYSSEQQLHRKESAVVRDIMTAMKTEIYPPICFLLLESRIDETWKVMSSKDVEDAIRFLLRSTTADHNLSVQALKIGRKTIHNTTTTTTTNITNQDNLVDEEDTEDSDHDDDGDNHNNKDHVRGNVENDPGSKSRIEVDFNPEITELRAKIQNALMSSAQADDYSSDGEVGEETNDEGTNSEYDVESKSSVDTYFNEDADHRSVEIHQRNSNEVRATRCRKRKNINDIQCRAASIGTKKRFQAQQATGCSIRINKLQREKTNYASGRSTTMRHDQSNRADNTDTNAINTGNGRNHAPNDNIVHRSNTSSESGCIITLRNMCQKGMISNNEKNSLQYSMIISKSEGKQSLVEIAYDLLFVDGCQRDIAEEDFAAQCRRIALWN